MLGSVPPPAELRLTPNLPPALLTAHGSAAKTGT